MALATSSCLRIVLPGTGVGKRCPRRGSHRALHAGSSAEMLKTQGVSSQPGVFVLVCGFVKRRVPHRRGSDGVRGLKATPCSLNLTFAVVSGSVHL